MKISRFPKMMVLQKVRTQKLGFDEETAKAIGIAEAIKYAIFKNISSHTKETQKTKNLKTKFSHNNFDYEQFKILGIVAKGGKPFVGGKVYSFQDYDRYWIGRFNSKILEAIQEWAQNLINQVPKEILKS